MELWLQLDGQALLKPEIRCSERLRKGVIAAEYVPGNPAKTQVVLKTLCPAHNIPESPLPASRTGTITADSCFLFSREAGRKPKPRPGWISITEGWKSCQNPPCFKFISTFWSKNIQQPVTDYKQTFLMCRPNSKIRNAWIPQSVTPEHHPGWGMTNVVSA